MNRTTRIGAALSAGLLTFSLAACAEDDDPDVIVERGDHDRSRRARRRHRG